MTWLNTPGSEVETGFFLINICNELLYRAVGGRMIASNALYAAPDMFQGKSQAVKNLYDLLLDKLNQIGIFRKTRRETSIAFENRKVFASAMIRNRSIKLVLRANHRIASPRILSIERVADKNYDHTILLESRDEIDEELMKWLEEAYHNK